jgi:hypothetical protein
MGVLMAVNFRVDVVKRVVYQPSTGRGSKGAVDAYVVPCGMGAIRYAGKTWPSDARICEICRNMQPDEVAIASQWNSDKQEFEVYAVEYPSDYDASI